MTSHYGQQTTYLNGDVSYDGSVDSIDYTMIASKWGALLYQPPQPNTMTADQPTYDSIWLNWNIPDLAEDVEGFRIQRSLNGIDFEIYDTVPVTQTTYLDEGLASGQRYWYRVRAYGGATDGTAYTPKRSATAVLYAPVITDATALPDGTVSVAWTEQASNIDHFDIQATSGATTINFNNVPGTEFSKILTGLSEQADWSIRVKAYSPYIDSAWSLPIMVSTPLKAPVGLHIDAPEIGYFTARLRWTNVSALATEIKVFRAKESGSPQLVASLPGNATDYGDSALEDGTDYSFYIVAANGSGESEQSNTVTITTRLAPPTAVELDASATTSSSIKLAWADQSFSETGFEILKQETLGAGYELIATVGETAGHSNSRNYVVGGLEEGTDYQFVIRTVKNDLRSEDVIVSATTKFFQPAGFTASVANYREVNLAWQDNSQAEGGYRVTWWSDDPALPASFDLPANATGYTVVGLSEQTLYHFTLDLISANEWQLFPPVSASAQTPAKPSLPQQPPPPYRVSIVGPYPGTTVYFNTGNLYVANSDWLYTSTPEEAVLQAVSGWCTAYANAEHTILHARFDFPDSYSIYYNDPATPGLEHLPLKADAPSQSYRGVIGLEDLSDNDFDDLLYGVYVYSLNSVPVVGLTSTTHFSSSPSGSPDPDAAEPADPGQFVLWRAMGDTGQPLTVDLQPLAGSATPGTDYELFNGSTKIVPGASGAFSVTFPADQTEIYLDVRPLDDAKLEPAETVFAQVKASTGYFVEPGNSATVTIADDDIDVDIDSDNTNGLGLPARTPEEETIEDDSSKPGKIIAVSDGDSDGDGIPDFADGFNWDGITDATTSLSKDDKSSGTRLVPMVIQLPPNVDPTKARIKFEYSASDPAGVTTVSDPQTQTTTFTPAPGFLRLWWPHDGGVPFQEQRDKRPYPNSGAGGDWLRPGDSLNPWLIGIDEATNSLKVWVEAVRPSETAGDQQIKVWLDAKGDGSWVGHDEVRVSGYAVDISALYSNQFFGNTANSLPGNAGGGASAESKKNYMLMGALGSNLASVRADVTVSHYSPPNLLFIFGDPTDPSLNSSGSVGVHASAGASNLTLYSNSVRGTTEATDMYVGFGLDTDGNGSLGTSEIVRWFKKFDAKVVSTAARAYALNRLPGFFPGLALPIASNWIHSFATDQGFADATNVADTLTATDPRLSHHVGALFAGDAAPINKAIFGLTSPVAQAVAGSVEVSDKLTPTLNARLTQIISEIQATGTNHKYISIPVSQDQLGINFENYVGGIPRDLHYAIGHASFTSLSFWCDATLVAGSLTLSNFVVQGQLVDLYDFNYDDGGRAGLAAMIQAGFSGGGTAGHVSKIEINLNNTVDYGQNGQVVISLGGGG